MDYSKYSISTLMIHKAELNSVKHKASKRRITYFEREIGKVKSEINKRYLNLDSNH